MNSAKGQSAVKAYGKVGAQSGIAYASPHRLILMLLEGALDKIANAKGHMSRGEIAQKGNFISWAVSIVGGLRASLDFDKGGELAANLEALYDYMERTLVIANAENNLDKLDEVSTLLNTIKEAWIQIGDEQNATAEVSAQDSQEGGSSGITDTV